MAQTFRLLASSHFIALSDRQNRVMLQMKYQPEGVTENVGCAVMLPLTPLRRSRYRLKRPILRRQ